MNARRLQHRGESEELSYPPASRDVATRAAFDRGVAIPSCNKPTTTFISYAYACIA